MSASVGSQASRKSANPLDEAAWQAWVLKGSARDSRGRAARMKAVKWTSMAGLLVAMGLAPHLAPYDVIVRFVVAAGAMAVMFQAFQARRYAFAAVFGSLALLYNPVAPVFSFSGEWQRAVAAASAVPFAASLAWHHARPAHHA